MKHFIFLAAVTLSVLSFSNAKGQAIPGLEKNIELFIKGHRYETYFILDTFKKGFVLQLSDPKYRIKQYNLNWTSDDGAIHEVVLQDTVVNASTKDYSLANAGGQFFFDNIIVEEGGKTYLIPAVSFLLVGAEIHNTIYETLARNKAYIKGQSGEEMIVSAGLFNNSFILGLRDTSYTILSFDLVLICQDEEKDLLFPFKGDSYSPTPENLKLALRRIRDNDMVLFTNIKATKDNRLYIIPELIFIIRGR